MYAASKLLTDNAPHFLASLFCERLDYFSRKRISTSRHIVNYYAHALLQCKACSL